MKKPILLSWSGGKDSTLALHALRSSPDFEPAGLLTTINEDGSPHVTPVGAIWLDGAFWFQTGSGTKKSANVARDPRCSLATSIKDADVVVEGDARVVTDPDAVARAAAKWAEGGWPVAHSNSTDPSA